MTDLTEQRLHEMMESLGAKSNEDPSTLERKVGAFYRSFMDQAQVEQLGAKPIQPELNETRILSDPDRNQSARSRLLSETGIRGPKDRLSIT